MHELSLVGNIVSIAENEIAKTDGRLVEEIELEIGSLATVDLDAFNFAWEYGVKATLLEGAIMRIHQIEGRAQCQQCRTEFPMIELYDPCPACNSYNSLVLQGQELRIRSLIVT
jgi:hydrogenase nickel incorporation protein HypA/HybF